MIRQSAAISISVLMAAWLSPAWLSAQPLVLTVSAASADIYSSPSTGSPVIGHVLRGTRLEVTRELGSWVKVWWPIAVERRAVACNIHSVRTEPPVRARELRERLPVGATVSRIGRQLPPTDVERPDAGLRTVAVRE